MGQSSRCPQGPVGIRNVLGNFIWGLEFLEVGRGARNCWLFQNKPKSTYSFQTAFIRVGTYPVSSNVGRSKTLKPVLSQGLSVPVDQNKLDLTPQCHSLWWPKAFPWVISVDASGAPSFWSLWSQFLHPNIKSLLCLHVTTWTHSDFSLLFPQIAVTSIGLLLLQDGGGVVQHLKLILKALLSAPASLSPCLSSSPLSLSGTGYFLVLRECFSSSLKFCYLLTVLPTGLLFYPSRLTQANKCNALPKRLLINSSFSISLIRNNLVNQGKGHFYHKLVKLLSPVNEVDQRENRNSQTCKYLSFRIVTSSDQTFFFLKEGLRCKNYQSVF